MLAFLCLRLALAAILGFSVDESYTIGNARDLQLSYFDHPPLHYWIVWAFQPILGKGHAARLPFVALFAGSSWLLYLLTRRLFGAWAGVWAVLALNLSFYFTIGAGSFVLPDGPLDFCLLAAALTLANACFADADPPSPWRTWVLAGIWIGLAVLSKFQAVLFGFGVLLFLATVPQRRRLLLHPAPWVGGAIALALFSPVVIWNARHGWVTFAYQGGRGLPQGGLHIANALVDLVGQVAWLTPWVFVPLALACWPALRAGRAQERSWFCICLGLPAIVLFAVTPLWGDRGLPHWPMPGWLMLFPILGDYLDRRAGETRTWRWAVASAALLVGLGAIVGGHAVTGFGKLWVPDLLKHDPTLEAVEWSPLVAEIKARGYLDRKDLLVIAPHWIDGGRIDRALDGRLPVIVAGGGEPKNFAFRSDPTSFLGHDALIIGRTMEPWMETALRPYFQSVEELPPFSFGRSGLKEIELHIMLAKDLQKPLPTYYAR